MMAPRRNSGGFTLLCGVPDRNDWIAVTRILSILTDRGKPEDRTALHSDDIRWGRALCDGGDRFWEPSPQDRKPNLLSEIRLVQLLAARGEMRRVLMTRAARALSAKHGPGVQVNVKDIAWSLLNPGKTETIAKPYYNRLDGVSREHTTENVE